MRAIRIQRLVLVVACSASAIMTGPAGAQPTTGSIQVTVTGASAGNGSPVEGATVEVRPAPGQEGSPAPQTVTNGQGTTVSKDLSPGIYRVAIKAKGRTIFRIVRVETGKATSVSAGLDDMGHANLSDSFLGDGLVDAANKAAKDCDAAEYNKAKGELESNRKAAQIELDDYNKLLNEESERTGLPADRAKMAEVLQAANDAAKAGAPVDAAKDQSMIRFTNLILRRDSAKDEVSALDRRLKSIAPLEKCPKAAETPPSRQAETPPSKQEKPPEKKEDKKTSDDKSGSVPAAFNFSVSLVGGVKVPLATTAAMTGVDRFFGEGHFLISNEYGGSWVTTGMFGARARAEAFARLDAQLAESRRTVPASHFVEVHPFIEFGIQTAFGAQSFIQPFEGISATPQAFGSSRINENLQIPFLAGVTVPIGSASGAEPGKANVLLDLYGPITLDSWTQTLQGRESGAPGGPGFFGQNRRFTVDPTVGVGVRLPVGDIGVGVPGITVGVNTELQFRPGSVVTAPSANFPSETYYGTVNPTTNMVIMARIGIPLGGR